MNICICIIALCIMLLPLVTTQFTASNCENSVLTVDLYNFGNISIRFNSSNQFFNSTVNA